MSVFPYPKDTFLVAIKALFKFGNVQSCYALNYSTNQFFGKRL